MNKFIFSLCVVTGLLSLHAHAGDSSTVQAHLRDIHPTQFSLGMIEIQAKETDLSGMSDKKLEKYIGAHIAPAVIGPHGMYYITDGHHLYRALEDIGQDTVPLTIQADWSGLSEQDFWNQMKAKNWVYLEDARGVVHTNPADLPSSLEEMQNDVYRSLAWAVREAGGYEKTDVPFQDFFWADYFRARVHASTDGSDFDAATQAALAIAHSPDARNLPGYSASQ